MDNHEQNNFDAAELISRAESRDRLNAAEVRSLFLDRNITTERLQTAAAAMKRDIFSESVTLAATIAAEAETTETELQRVIAAGHKRLNIVLSGDSQTDRTTVGLAAHKFDIDHCGCIELTMNSGSGADTDIDRSAALVFIHPCDLHAFELKHNIDPRIIGVEIDIDCDPESFCRQLEYISAAKAFVAVARLRISSEADKTMRHKYCALAALALPYAKIGVELDSTDDTVEVDTVEYDAVEYVKSGASLLYLRGDATSRTDSVVRRLSAQGILCGFCAACVSCDRYADGYSQLCTDGQLYNYCYLNSLLSLREYAADHASRDTRIAATDLILNRLYGIGNKQVRDQMAQAMKEIRSGERGFRF